MSDRVFLGVKPSPLTCSSAKSDQELVSGFIDQGFDIVLLPITNSKYREHSQKIFHYYVNDGAINNFNGLIVPAPNLNEVNLVNGDHLQNTIGLVSSWIELESSDKLISEFSYQVLKNELCYAKYIGIRNILVAPPKDTNKLANFSNLILQALNEVGDIYISISLPICEEPHLNERSGRLQPDIDYLSTWDMWNSIRVNCDYHENLTISLALPKTNIPQYVVDRWFAEPIQCLLISSSVFTQNSKNYPVFSKFNQFLLLRLTSKKFKPLLLLHNIEKSSNSAASYINYLNHLIKSGPKLSLYQSFNINSIDIIKKPLQPLKDNLDNSIYEIFEKDSYKYDMYGRAMSKALQTIVKIHNLSQKSNKEPTVVTTSERTLMSAPIIISNDNYSEQVFIAVMGAGRGPLIDQLLSVLTTINVKNCRIFAIEKNPNAIITLMRKNKERWADRVEIIESDMRQLGEKINFKFDLIISELLGSFGDNELSPECLDGLEFHLKKQGIMIPKNYTSVIAPAFSPKMYQTLKTFDTLSSFHQPYNVNLQSCDILSTKINELWTFEHPDQAFSSEKLPLNSVQINIPPKLKEDSSIGSSIHTLCPTVNKSFDKHNQRCSISSFKVRRRGTVHGFLGMFTAELYGDIIISTNPSDTNYNENLTSWFPIWFPLEQPVYVSDDTEIELSMRRQINDKYVWYEWSMESFIYIVNESPELGDGNPTSEQVRVRTSVSKIHNSGGRCSKMDL